MTIGNFSSGRSSSWSLQSWTIRELSFDLHESDLSDDYKILTTYEQRWLGEGKPTNFVRARSS